MKKLFGIIMLGCLLSACGSSIQDASDRGELKLVGYSQEDWVTRELTIPTEDGKISVKCYLDEATQEICEGTFEDGSAANADQLESAMAVTHAKPYITDALKGGCENKTLLVSLYFKTQFEKPNSDICYQVDLIHPTYECDGEVVSFEEADKRMNAYRKTLSANMRQARNAMLDQFIALNPSLVSKDIEDNYRTHEYGALDIKMPACDYDAFIKRNSTLLESITFRGLVDAPMAESCDTPLDYKVLLIQNDYYIETCARKPPMSLSFNTKDALLTYLAEAPKDVPIRLKEADINAIDFEHSAVYALYGGYHGTTAYHLNVEAVCKDAPINVYIDHCTGKPEDSSMTCPLMLLQVPKGNYDVNFVPRNLVCE